MINKLSNNLPTKDNIIYSIKELINISNQNPIMCNICLYYYGHGKYDDILYD